MFPCPVAMVTDIGLPAAVRILFSPARRRAVGPLPDSPQTPAQPPRQPRQHPPGQRDPPAPPTLSLAPRNATAASGQQPLRPTGAPRPGAARSSGRGCSPAACPSAACASRNPPLRPIPAQRRARRAEPAQTKPGAGVCAFVRCLGVTWNGARLRHGPLLPPPRAASLLPPERPRHGDAPRSPRHIQPSATSGCLHRPEASQPARPPRLRRRGKPRCPPCRAREEHRGDLLVSPWPRAAGRADPSPRRPRAAGRARQGALRPGRGSCPSAEPGFVLAVQPSFSRPTFRSRVLRSVGSAGSSDHPPGLRTARSHPGPRPWLAWPGGDGSDPGSVAVAPAQPAPAPPAPTPGVSGAAELPPHSPRNDRKRWRKAATAWGD